MRPMAMDMQIDVKGLELNETLHDVVVRQARTAAETFGDRVGRVKVRFTETRHPNGGAETRCRIQADVDALGTVVVQDTHDTAFLALASATERFTRTTSRRLRDQRLDRERRIRALSGAFA